MSKMSLRYWLSTLSIFVWITRSASRPGNGISAAGLDNEAVRCYPTLRYLRGSRGVDEQRSCCSVANSSSIAAFGGGL